MGKIRRNQGFTIIELLIVVVALAILAMISIMGYNFVIERAKNAQTKQALAQWVRILRIYRAETGGFPSYGSSCLGLASDFPADSLFADKLCQKTQFYNMTYEPLAMDNFNTTMKPITPNYPKIPRIPSLRVGGEEIRSRGFLYETMKIDINTQKATEVAIRYYLYGKNQDCYPGKLHFSGAGGDNGTSCRYYIDVTE